MRQFLICCLISVFFFHCLTGEKRRRYVKDPEKAPDYLRGRLPGPNWTQHGQPKFNALFSMETTKLKKCYIALFQERSKVEADQFTAELLSGKEVLYKDLLNSNEGEWIIYGLEDKNRLLKLAVLPKTDSIYWSTYLCAERDSIALYAEDFERFLKEFWFLYR